MNTPIAIFIATLMTLTQPAGQSPGVRERIAVEAEKAAPLAETNLGRAFLAAADDLPPIREPRTIYFRRDDRTGITPTDFASLSEIEREAYVKMPVGESLYYGLYSTPIAWLRALDLVAAAGLEGVDGARIADFGFGNIAHLRMLAGMGAHTVGIEIDGLHDAVFRMPSDQGAVPRANKQNPDAAGPPAPQGSVALAFGQYPATEEMRATVGTGLALFMSKNTLKKGYIHPEREADPRQLVHLGVDDDTYLNAVHDALAPAGFFLIYNIYPKPAPPDKPYIPWASGQCPFDEASITNAGFEIITRNADDSPEARAMGRALNWNEGMTDDEFNDNFNAMVTILRRPERTTPVKPHPTR